jgi:hypothetical protein
MGREEQIANERERLLSQGNPAGLTQQEADAQAAREVAIRYAQKQAVSGSFEQFEAADDEARTLLESPDVIEATRKITETLIRSSQKNSPS